MVGTASDGNERKTFSQQWVFVTLAAWFSPHYSNPAVFPMLEKKIMNGKLTGTWKKSVLHFPSEWSRCVCDRYCSLGAAQSGRHEKMMIAVQINETHELTAPPAIFQRNCLVFASITSHHSFLFSFFAAADEGLALTERAKWSGVEFVLAPGGSFYLQSLNTSTLVSRVRARARTWDRRGGAVLSKGG